MLVLSRRLNEKVLFPTIAGSVQILAIKPGAVRLGIEAPPHVTVLREELAPPAVSPVRPEAILLQNLHAELQTAISRLDLLRRQLPGTLPGEAAQTLGQLDRQLNGLADHLEAATAGLDEQKRLTQVGPAGRRSHPVGRRPHRVGPASRRSALIVEDNANERELLAHFLRSAGLEVTTAGDGIDALECLRRRGRPDVLLLDMGMPRCDGPTTVQTIRRNPAYQGLKIFAVTGHYPDEFDLRVGPTGVDRWFHKPIDPAELVRDLAQELPPVREASRH
jgi:carbon storage regulator CsrA